eukprot:6207539-Pleurochrysis_carterae.AAC.1
MITRDNLRNFQFQPKSKDRSIHFSRRRFHTIRSSLALLVLDAIKINGDRILIKTTQAHHYVH